MKADLVLLPAFIPEFLLHAMPPVYIAFGLEYFLSS
jgi:hypothetical protein